MIEAQGPKPPNRKNKPPNPKVNLKPSKTGGGSITKRVTIAPTPTPEEEERQKAVFAVTRHKQASSEAAGAHNSKARCHPDPNCAIIPRLLFFLPC